MFQAAKDKLIDRFLTLYLISDGFRRKQLRYLNETKLQKLVFLSELDMIKQGEKGFNFYFLRLHYGPYSFELATEKARLISMGFLEEKTLKPTKDAHSLVEDFSEMICRNNTILCKINSVNDLYAPLELDYLLETVHSMPWGKTTIHALPERTPMLYPMKQQAVKTQMVINEKELEDLTLNLDPNMCADLDEATEDVKQRRFLSHEQVFPKL